jgi:DNA-binding Lrp family transcriptional regulator
MSTHVTSWVFKHSDEATPGRRLVLLVLADHADKDGRNAYPSVATIAHETRMSERGVRYALRELERSGQIESLGIHPQLRTTEYRVVMGQPLQGGTECLGATDDTAMGQMASEKVSPFAPKPSLRQPSLEPSSSVEGPKQEKDRTSTPKGLAVSQRENRPERRATYYGKAVPAEVVATAERVLDVFNEAAGRRMHAWRRSGQPSAQLKQIYGQMLDRPDVDQESWERAVRHTVANPPGWLNGRPVDLGDIFGERAVEHALVNPGTPLPLVASNGNGRHRRSTAADYQALKGTLG